MTLFERIINREIPSKIIFEDEKYIAFLDINPKRKGHFLVVPKKVSTNVRELSNDEYIDLMIKTREWAEIHTKNMGVDGYTLETNAGAKAGQEVFHTHIHVIPAAK